jgi:hypothetical protein
MLRKERKWAAIPRGKRDIQMSRVLSGRAVTVLLESTGKGSFNLKPATYRYRSSSSHFDYSEPEERFSRNKNVFKSLFRALKESTISAYIDNLDSFLVINKTNDRSDKRRLNGELKKLTTR